MISHLPDSAAWFSTAFFIIYRADIDDTWRVVWKLDEILHSQYL